MNLSVFSCIFFYSKSGYFFSHAYAAILDKYVKYAQMPSRLLFCLQEAKEIKIVGVEDQFGLLWLYTWRVYT